MGATVSPGASGEVLVLTVTWTWFGQSVHRRAHQGDHQGPDLDGTAPQFLRTTDHPQLPDVPWPWRDPGWEGRQLALTRLAGFGFGFLVRKHLGRAGCHRACLA